MPITKTVESPPICLEKIEPFGLLESLEDGDFDAIESVVGEFSGEEISVRNVLRITDRLKDVGRVKNAIFIVNHIFSSPTKPMSVRVKLGEYYFLDGKPKETVKLYLSAVADKPEIEDTFWFRKNIGEAYFYSSDRLKAMDNLRSALVYCKGDFEKQSSLIRYFVEDDALGYFFDTVNGAYAESYSAGIESADVDVKHKNLLVVDSCVPQADKDAGSVLMVGFLRTLSKQGYQVWFYTDESDAPTKYIINLLEIGVRFINSNYFENGNQMVADVSAEIDAFMLTRVDSGGNYFEVVKRLNLTKPIIFNTVDLHFLRTQRHFETNGNPATRLESKRQKRRESFLIRNSDATIVISNAEKKLLDDEGIYGNLWQLPIIVDFPDEIASFSERTKDIAFIGSYAHLPNIDAVDYFCKEIWPCIYKDNGESKLIIVGPNVPKRWMTEFDGKYNIEVRGFVEELEEFLATISCTVVPLRVGAGQKGKIATSLAHGVPCVSSATGVEGMSLTDGENVIVCDTPAEWSAAITACTKSKEKWSQLSAAGVKHATECYSEAKVAGNLVQKLDALISSPFFDRHKGK